MQTDDLLRRLQYDQEFRQEVRRLVLSEELLTLPEKTERLRAELHEEIRRFWQGLDAWREEMREGFAVMREEFSRVWDAISATRQEMHEEFSRVWD
ncbi:MAG: hypothetical protein RMK62_10900, partial [Armatimonadota bacterium]|nr:hypothetical protein [Armatimonadota bacterium]